MEEAKRRLLKAAKATTAQKMEIVASVSRRAAEFERLMKWHGGEMDGETRKAAEAVSAAFLKAIMAASNAANERSDDGKEGA